MALLLIFPTKLLQTFKQTSFTHTHQHRTNIIQIMNKLMMLSHIMLEGVNSIIIYKSLTS